MSRESERVASEVQRSVLADTLDLAVPLAMAELWDCPDKALAAIAREAASIVGSRGDVLLFGGQHCASTFNQLARGLAAMALVAPGGATYLGRHWCCMPGCSGSAADHPQPGEGSRTVTDFPLPVTSADGEVAA
ncbi:hypothetical protein ABZ953_06610 [Streptomyces sp. NPDC046465]|uniref:hypothetical protein n=1 Tax=Streptomyces sp. NPDC046465 TaxID=3155810 RepID=UPI00340C6C54